MKDLLPYLSAVCDVVLALSAVLIFRILSGSRVLSRRIQWKPKKAYGMEEKKDEVDKFFEHAFYITVDRDREVRFLNRFFRKFGCTPRRWEGFRLRISGRGNIAITHMSIVKMAKALDWPYVCIFEDDAYPRADARDMLRHCVMNFPDDASIVYLGWVRVQSKRDRNIEAYGDCWTGIDAKVVGAHAWVIFRKAYDEFIDRVHTIDEHVDISMSNFGGQYRTRDPIFIQYHEKLSTNNGSGYFFWGLHPDPPDGFERDEEFRSDVTAEK